MKKILFTFIIGLYVINAQAQNLIAVEHNGTSSFYTNIDTAFMNAVDADNIYLPGGYISSLSGTLKIGKNLNIYGAGCNSDSSASIGNTIISNPIEVLPTASGGMITGIYSNNSLYVHDTVSNFTISRCYINSNITIGGSSQYIPASNISIIESIITGDVIGACSSTKYPINVVVQNSFIGNASNCFSSTNYNNWLGLTCKNCILSGTSYCNYNCTYTLQYITESSFENCVFIDNYNGGYGFNSAYNTFKNCMFKGGSPSVSSNSVYNCIFNQNIDSIFIKFQGSNTYDIKNNYHLKSNSPAKNAGIDGLDIGLYGGSFPWKEGGIPINPHIQTQYIKSSTDNSGKLPVKINVKAQTK